MSSISKEAAALLVESQIDSRLDDWLTKGENSLEEIKGAWIAGGYIRSIFDGTSPGDIDVYCETEEDRKKVEDVLKTNKLTVQFETKNAKTFYGCGFYVTRPTQVIKKVAPIRRGFKGAFADGHLDNFDFLPCAIAYNPSRKILVESPGAIDCAQTKTLTPLNPSPQALLQTLERIAKYTYMYGYRFSDAEARHLSSCLKNQATVLGGNRYIEIGTGTYY